MVLTELVTQLKASVKDRLALKDLELFADQVLYETMAGAGISIHESKHWIWSMNVHMKW